MIRPQWRHRILVPAAVVAVALASVAAVGAVREPADDADRAAPAVVQPRLDCAELRLRTVETVPGEVATIDSATIVPATASTPEYCEVTGVNTPQQQFVVRLPTSTWTQRYLQAGCGGFCGSVLARNFGDYVENCPGLSRGDFAVAFENQGHVGSNASFALDPALVEDFAYEAEHQLSIVAKNVIEMYYGQQSRHNYFAGCSGGGRQALNVVQRYPRDFDGVIASAPANNWVAMFVFSFAWSARANLASDGSQILTAEDLPVLHQRALAACDDRDGLVDGLITDPRVCEFDPETLLCKDGATADCLTDAEVEAARKIYQGAVDENGVPFYPGYPNGGQPIGSEMSWAHFIVRDHPRAPSGNEALADGHLRYLAALNQTKSYDWRTIPFTRQTFDEVSAMTPVMDATDPDLREFRDAGGKLIFWHGWNDTPIVAQGSIAYYEAIRKYSGASTDGFLRFYLVPGMYHCEGGDGPDQLDLLTPLTDWVEHGAAPDRIVVSEKDDAGTVTRTRPIFPYPQVPVYDGTGDPNSADSFTAGPGREYPPARWVGEFRTGYQHWCQVRGGKLVCSPHRGDN